METFLRLREASSDHYAIPPFLVPTQDAPATELHCCAPLSSSRHRGRSEEQQRLRFTRVLTETATQTDVFLSVVFPKIEALVRDDQDGLVFAMGVTGSGKSYTMFGQEGAPGLIQMAISTLLTLTTTMETSIHRTAALAEAIARLKEDTQPLSPPRLSFSFAELYNERFGDLLQPTTTTLPLKRARHGGTERCFIAGLHREPIHSTASASAMIQEACRARRVFATDANSTSSRSHAILTLYLDEKSLTLVDLAGTERQKQAGTQGAQLGEAGAINLSLMAVGQCLEALKQSPGTRKEHRFPARQSKLTELLFDGRYWPAERESFGTTVAARVAMLVCVDPTRFYEENVQMLKYAADAGLVREGSRLSHPQRRAPDMTAQEQAVVDRLSRPKSNLRSRSLMRSPLPFEILPDHAQVDEEPDYWRDLALSLQALNETLEDRIRAELMDEAEQVMSAMEARHRQEMADLRDMFERQSDAKVDLLAGQASQLALRPYSPAALNRQVTPLLKKG